MEQLAKGWKRARLLIAFKVEFPHAQATLNHSHHRVKRRLKASYNLIIGRRRGVKYDEDSCENRDLQDPKEEELCKLDQDSADDLYPRSKCSDELTHLEDAQEVADDDQCQSDAVREVAVVELSEVDAEEHASRQFDLIFELAPRT